LAPLRRSTLRPPGNCRARRQTPAHKFRARRRRYPPLPRLLSARLRLLPRRGHRVLPICSAVHRSTGVDVASGRSPDAPESVGGIGAPTSSGRRLRRARDPRLHGPKFGELRIRDTRSHSLVVVPPVVTLPMMFHGCVAALPVVTLAAIGIRIARAKVLAICIRVELRAIAGIGDNGLCQCTGCEGRPDNSGGSNQSGEQDGNARQLRQWFFGRLLQP
jgi:hypothetical protein